MPDLSAQVVYAGDVHGWEPAGIALVDFTQDNPMLDAQRQALAAEFPRRTFETELRLTVGGLRADSGTYYTGRERINGFAKLADLQRTHKLGIVNSCHLINKTFDRDDHSRNESTFVLVEASFTRPQWPAAVPSASVAAHASGPFGDRHLDSLVAAAWATFQRLVDVAPATTASATWDWQGVEYRNPVPGEPPVAPFMLFDRSVVARLGGGAKGAERLGAFDWKAVRGDESNGVVMQLGRRPEDTVGERLAQIRTHLRNL